MHVQEFFEVSDKKTVHIAVDMEGMKLGKMTEAVDEGNVDMLTYARFLIERVRTDNVVEWLDHEIARLTRAVSTFLNGRSVLMLVAAGLFRYIADNEWGSRRYLDVIVGQVITSMIHGTLKKSVQEVALGIMIGDDAASSCCVIGTRCLKRFGHATFTVRFLGGIGMFCHHTSSSRSTKLQSATSLRRCRTR